jgi:nucleotide-binding universal stress UspA family protein
VAIAVAAAGLRTQTDAGIGSIGVVSTDGDTAARQSAEALSAKLGATIVELGPPSIDLIVVGSQPNGSARRITLSGASRTMLNTARGSVLVLPSATVLQL